MKKLYITFCLLLVSLCIHAQMISGIIVDKKNQPLEFANIVLFLCLILLFTRYYQ